MEFSSHVLDILGIKPGIVHGYARNCLGLFREQCTSTPGDTREPPAYCSVDWGGHGEGFLVITPDYNEVYHEHGKDSQWDEHVKVGGH